MLGTKIRFLLKLHKKTLKGLADSIGVTPQAIHTITKTNRAKRENIEKMATFFNVPVLYFLDDSITVDNHKCEQPKENPPEPEAKLELDYKAMYAKTEEERLRLLSIVEAQAHMLKR